MERRLQEAIDHVLSCADKAIAQENFDAYDKHQGVVDLLKYISSGNRPLHTSGYFHSL